MGKELLVEIGTEEIPARFTPTALENLADLMRKELVAQGVGFGEIRTLGTPRRLALWVGDVGESQEDHVEKRLGPPRHVAFDEEGNPTKAAEGFAKAQGVAIEDLETITTERGEYLCVVQRQKGGKTADILRECLPRVITSLPFPKSMRWGDSDLRFVRPIHWILALFGGQVVPFRLESIESGDMTYGHRFMSPGGVRVNGLSDYVAKLSQASVIVEPEERKRVIEEGIHEVAAGVSGKILLNRALLEEVTCLVEYPVVVMGDFPKEFLSLPKEVIIHAMEDHQRYFPVVDPQGSLLPQFVCVCNTQAKDMEVVRRGHERVLRARLSDARFFFDEDIKVSLEEKVEDLKGVIFQAKLGTSYDKVRRLRSLSCFLARILRPDLEGLVDRAAFLCKADLVSGMVAEFPGLQGVMGREYALRSGEPGEVANAIYEHYLPVSTGDRLPSSPIGDFVSMADRIDTITGCFGVGLIPTGAGDPLGLRRQALGILNILVAKRYSLSMRTILSESIELLKDRLEGAADEVKASVVEFFRQRFQNLLISQGVPHDVVEAVLGVDFDDVLDCQARIVALSEIKSKEEFAPLAVAFKRVVNISRECDFRKVTPSLFKEDTERMLHSALLDVEKRLDRLLMEKEYRKALAELTQLKKPVDQFFDSVLVMEEDKKVRENRLALLGRIADLFSHIADFSRIVTD